VELREKRFKNILKYKFDSETAANGNNPTIPKIPKTAMVFGDLQESEILTV
jgi:hypothetical protein